MNVRWYDRILILLGSLVILAMGALAIAAGGGLLPSLWDTAWSHEFNTWLGAKWQWTPVIIVGGIVLVVLSILTLIRACTRGGEGGRYYTLQSEPEGNVRISVHAIDNLVHKSIDQYGQVVSSRVKIGGKEDNMEITLHMTLHTEVNIPGLVGDLREDIMRSLEKSAGVTVQKVQIYVDAAKDGKEKDGVRYLEGRRQEPKEAPEPDPVNTASYYTAPVVITEDKAAQAPENEAATEPKPPTENLSAQAFPFPEADVPPKTVPADSSAEESEEETEAHE